MAYLFIGLAGMIGAMLRYSIDLAFEFSGHGFPFATMITNVLGCVILGWFTTRIKQSNVLPPRVMTAISTGLIGSFTTFSTFSVEAARLIQNTHIATAFIYVLLSLILGPAAAWAGYNSSELRNQKESNHNVD